jgi:hypothetical protein
MPSTINVEDPYDGEDKQVTIQTRQDRELDAMEVILNEFYTRLQTRERYRIARYLADRFYSEGTDPDAQT